MLINIYIHTHNFFSMFGLVFFLCVCLCVCFFSVIKDVKLENVEYDVGGPIKNLKFYLEDISKVVVESPNDFFPIKQVQPKLGALMKDALKLKLKLKFPLWRPKKCSYKF